MKQYFYISLLLCTTINISFVLTASETYVNNILSNQTETLSSKSNSTVNATTTILTEGGKVDLISNIPHHEREHVSTSTTVAPTIKKTSNATSANSSTISKSGSTTTVSPKVNEVKPATDVDYYGDSRVKPRKGVSLNDSVVDEIRPTNPINSTTKINLPVSSTVSTNLTSQKSTTTVSTTTFIPRKPTVTFGSDEEDPPPRAGNSRLFNGGKEITHKNSSSVSSPPAHTEEKHDIVGNRHYAKGSAYVLPIVLTILAVPLLAIILTVVYKRGAEWWNHRHYRRMDFLIDGMYNN